MLFCSHIIFLLRDQWLIERLSEAMSAASVGNNFSLVISIEIFISNEKKSDSSRPELYKSLLKLFDSRTEYVSQEWYCGSTRSSSEPVAAHSDCHRLGNALLLCSPFRPPKLYGSAPQKLGFWFCSQNLPLSSQVAFFSDCQILKLEIYRLTNGLVKVLSAPKSQNNLCGVWIVFRFFENGELEDSCE